MSQNWGDVMKMCKAAFPITKMMDVTKTADELDRYIKGLSKNPHVVIIANTGECFRVETVKGGARVGLTQPEVIRAMSSFICREHRCAKCLLDLADSDLHFKCPLCRYVSCVDCIDVEMNQGCVCGEGSLVSNFEHIEIGGREDAPQKGWWRTFAGKYLW